MPGETRQIGRRFTVAETDTGPSFGPEPALAERREATDGPEEWTFKLRQGVKFHSGKTLDSKDIAYSIRARRGT